MAKPGQFHVKCNWLNCPQKHAITSAYCCYYYSVLFLSDSYQQTLKEYSKHIYTYTYIHLSTWFNFHIAELLLFRLI